MNCSDCTPLLGAALDGELDARNAIEVDQHLAGCADCQRRFAASQALQASLSAAAKDLRYRLAPAQREKITAAWRLPAERHEERSWRGALQIAALLAVALIGFGLGRLGPGRASNTFNDELVARHAHARLAGHLMDVVSSDRHTVKPWFNGKVDYAPTVVDLASQGYPLIGGRLEFVDGKATAVMVYRAGQHTIDVFTWPASTSTRSFGTGTDRGYHLVGWTDRGMSFCAVSDAAPDRLDEFARLLQQAAPRP
jgi:anti-sigma factor RsiW